MSAMSVELPTALVVDKSKPGLGWVCKACQRRVDEYNQSVRDQPVRVTRAAPVVPEPSRAVLPALGQPAFAIYGVASRAYTTTTTMEVSCKKKSCRFNFLFNAGVRPQIFFRRAARGGFFPLDPPKFFQPHCGFFPLDPPKIFRRAARGGFFLTAVFFSHTPHLFLRPSTDLIKV